MFSRLSVLTLGRDDFSQHVTAESFIFAAGVSQALVRFRRRGMLGDSLGRRGVLGDSPPRESPSNRASTPLLRNHNRLRIRYRMHNCAAYGPVHLQIRRKKGTEPCRTIRCPVHRFPLPLGFDTNDPPSMAKILLI